jgi:hypothetical protein
VEWTLKFMRPIDTGRSSKQLSEMSRSICSARRQNISQDEVCNHDCAKKGAQNTKAYEAGHKPNGGGQGRQVVVRQIEFNERCNVRQLLGQPLQPAPACIEHL